MRCVIPYEVTLDMVDYVFTVEETDGWLTRLSFDPPTTQDVIRETPLLLEVTRQLDEYFAGERTRFSLPVRVTGTTFQKQVWDALTKIPYGQTRSYGDVAAMIGNPKACRAVGSANRNNHVGLVIPCHRVINMSGSLGGFGSKPQLKRALLRHEGIRID